MELAGEYPDVIIAPTGGGSNFSGIVNPFVKNNLTEGKTTRILAVEPASCPSLTKGKYVYDFGDTAGMAPLVKMYTLGHDFVPPPVHAGGLRYHGMASIVCELYDQGLIDAVAIPQLETFRAGVTFARAEGIVPAPEAAHGIAGAIREALLCKETGEKKVILFNLCGHGHFDMSAYSAYFSGELEDFEYPADEVAAAMERVPVV
jgi:predicted alternative tryptophan synthase beta-subunit